MGSNEDARKINKLERKAFKEGTRCMKSFYHFFVRFWPEISGDKYIPSPHIEYIANVIQEEAMKVIRGETTMTTLIISVPPGSSKSSLCTIALPAWIWLHAPHLASTNVSYSARLSERHAKKARGITDSDKWHLLFDNIFKLKHGKSFEITTQNQNSMENNFRGERFNSSVGAAITGFHADLIVKDDMQSADDANSDTKRESSNHWDEQTLTSRHKKADCFLDIIIAQRLHEADLIGYTLNKNIPIKHICLPSEITNVSEVIPKEAESLYTDGILDPFRRPKPVLDQIKGTMGAPSYTCQYLQAPFDLNEQAIRPDMFEIIDPVDDLIFDLWIDSAYTKDTSNDPSGLMIAGFKNNTLFVKSAYNVYKTLPDLMKFIKELGDNGEFDTAKGRIWIEPKASGYSLAQYIETETDYNFVLIGQNTSKGEKNIVAQGKTARHTLIQPKAESNRIKLFKGKWNDEYLIQLCAFPRAACDEMVDTTGYAVHNYFNEDMFVKQYALDRLEKKLTGAINIKLTSQIQRNKISVSFEENDSGDIQLFDNPNKLYKYRYICVLALKGEGDRDGNTSIVVLDRLNMTVSAMFVSNSINPKKAGLKALEMASMYDTAKLVVIVQKHKGHTQDEGYDLGHIAIQEAKSAGYNNMYFRLSQNDIKKKREREWGFEVNQSTSREVYYNMKDLCETNKVQELPLDVFEEIKMLERKSEDGQIGAKEGYQTNSAMAYSVALKINDELYDKPKIKKSEKW